MNRGKLGREVVFVAPRIKMGSARLRAVQISNELARIGFKSRVVPEDSDIRNAIVIYIKGDDVERIARARVRNNLIVADLIDPHQKTFNVPGGARLHYHEVDPILFDAALFVNSVKLEEGKTWSKDMARACIPHPWDNRFRQPPQEHTNFSLLSLGQSGMKFSHPAVTHIDLPRHVLDIESIERARKFSCHLSIRDRTGLRSMERFGDPRQRFQSKI